MNEKKMKPSVKGGPYCRAAAIGLCLFWGWYLLEHFTSWRWVHARSGAEPISILYIAAGTVFAVLAPFAAWRWLESIAENGIPTVATVLSVDRKVTMGKSIRTVTFKYVFKGTEYTKKKSIISSVSDKLKCGGTLDIIVDKRRPKRVLVTAEIPIA